VFAATQEGLGQGVPARIELAQSPYSRLCAPVLRWADQIGWLLAVGVTALWAFVAGAIWQWRPLNAPLAV
jgi:hypothetical protein